MGSTRGISQMLRRLSACALAAGLILAGGCGSGNRLDTIDDGPGGGQWLLPISIVSTQSIPLVDGLYTDTAQNAIVLQDKYSGATVRVYDQTTIHSGQAIYDTDGNGDLDYIIITLRSLSAQAAANVTAVDALGATIPPVNFVKVAGVALEPIDATFNVAPQATIPIHSRAGALAGAVLKLFKYNDGTVYGRTFSDDIGDATGTWVEVGTATVDTGDTTVTFTLPDLDPAVTGDQCEFGQYAVAVRELAHEQGGGASL